MLVSAALPSGLTLTFSYDDAHRLIAAQDSMGNRVDRVLDTEGNALQETVTGNGGAVALAQQAAYDQLSRITAVTRPQ
jgi:YD repeat-containing protein